MAADLLAVGWGFHQAGDLPRAERAYRQLIQQEPDNVRGWCWLGALLQSRGDLAAAAHSLDQALRLHPSFAEALHHRGMVHVRTGQFAEATAKFREALRIEPANVEIQTNLALILAHQGQPAEAAVLLQAVLASRPDYARAQSNLPRILAQQAFSEGSAALEQKQLEKAANRFEEALRLRPKFPEASNNLGQALAQQGRVDDAIACFQQALSWRPDFVEAHNNLGVAYRQQKKLAEAEACCRAALRLRPNMAEAHNNLGVALQEQDRLSEALDGFRHAIQLEPGYVEAHSNLGGVLWQLGRLDDAARSLHEALRLRPDFAEAFNNLGSVLGDQGRFEEALASYNEALRLQPGYVEVHQGLGNVFTAQGRFDEAIAAYRAALRLKPDAARIHSNLVFVSHYHPGYDAQKILEEAVNWSHQHARPLERYIQPHTNRPDPERRLRVGYVSSEFRDHVDAFFLLPLLSNHDRLVVEVFCYADVACPDGVTARLRGYADVWRSTMGLPNQEVAELVRRDQIDVLVDLKLHTAKNRLLLFARKPAPIQVSWLGYPGTTGLTTIDYRLSDPYLDPPGRSDAFSSETVFRLADTFWCYDPLIDPAPPLNALPALANGAITFGCLNKFCKINARVLALWAKVLQAVPRSRLLLRAPRGDAREQVLAQLRREGVPDQRIEFTDGLPRPEYLKLHHRIDVALDPFPYNGHTTSLDGFWMGVPSVTLIGQTVVGRAGWSQLSNLGLQELAAETPEQYVALSAELAGDLPRLQQLRATLRQRMERSPLMDGPRFAREVEQAYRQFWRRWCHSRYS
jgi:predicted O-linked N-acetylglucosamine transferase (SPINDLY family)